MRHGRISRVMKGYLCVSMLGPFTVAVRISEPAFTGLERSIVPCESGVVSREARVVETGTKNLFRVFSCRFVVPVFTHRNPEPLNNTKTHERNQNHQITRRARKKNYANRLTLDSRLTTHDSLRLETVLDLRQFTPQ